LIGWLAALGASLVLSGLVTAVVGMILTALGFGGGAEAGTIGLFGVLLTLFLSFLIGGYTAGRMAGRDGSKHGLLVALLALIVTLILALLGGVAGLTNNLQDVALPGVPTEIAQRGLGTVLTLGGVIALLLPFVAGALGGSWGTKTGRRRP
jgi:predicted anti-sigma-YlaC factor YlaD